MGINRHTETEGVEVVTVDYPPVNALPSDGWFALADAIREAGRDQSTRVVVLRAEGRGSEPRLLGASVAEQLLALGGAPLLAAARSGPGLPPPTPIK